MNHSEVFETPYTFFASAPGRVNLIGEHTDYNGGFVLPVAISQTTNVSLSLRNDRNVRVVSDYLGEKLCDHMFLLGNEKQKHDWCDYIEGVTWHLAKNNLAIGGFNALITSSIPVGAGLSSSAALLVALLRVLRMSFSLPLDDVEIALASQEIENKFVGARVGIMDQMAASLADQYNALYLDTKDLTYRRIPLPNESMDLFVIDSGIKHSHTTGGYNQRRKECEEACRLLKIKSLREISEDSLPYLVNLPEVLARRARHVVTENTRVKAAVDALEARNPKLLGDLMVASHISLRDDYEVSTPEIDVLVESALAEPSVFGARLTGGGFGGSIIGICSPGQAKAVAPQIAQRYAQITGKQSIILAS